jgi:hypothetical protein
MTNTPSQQRFVRKLRSVKDCRTGDWRDVFRFRQESGACETISVPREDAKDVKKLAQHLNKKGADLPRNPEGRSKMIQQAIDAKATTIRYHIDRGGWQTTKTGQLWFAIGDDLIAAPEGIRQYAPPLTSPGLWAKNINTRGTLEDWKTKVAMKAMHSRAAVIAICASFAACSTFRV